MKRICECCEKEYDWEEGQLNWGKDYPKNGKGSVNSKRFCCYKCGRNDALKKQMKTNVERYGCENVFQNKNIKEKAKKTMIVKYGVPYTIMSPILKEKICQINIEKYGCEFPAQNEEVKKKAKGTLLEKYGDENYVNVKKAKETNLKRYGCENVFQNKDIQEKAKKTMIAKYGVDHYNKSQNFKDLFKDPKWVNNLSKKIYETKKRNHTQYQEIKENLIQKSYETKQKNNSFNISKPEEEIYQLLIQKFNLNDVEQQYKSDKYPFSCDFYVRSLDLYIEYQGTWTHGKEPFDENNLKHQEILERWKKRSQEINFKGEKKNYYKIAVHVWTVTDPLKRQTAKNNNLNWIEFFNLNQFYEWFNK